jgi:cellulose synthase/poly-beta-1,6-N-acetylglucosamine synthase-like glycosyltransferase
MGYARQLGVAAAKETYVMFVDSDVELSRGCIRTMLRDLEEHGWTGVHAQLRSTENVSYWQKAENEVLGDYYSRPGSRNRIDTIVALFRRKPLLEFPFDPHMREAAEDIDICRRLTEHGYHFGVSDAIAYHLHRREFSAFVRQRFRYGLGNVRLYVKYRETRKIINPLVTAFSNIIRTLHRLRLVPYYFVEGAVKFLGVAAGLPNALRQMNPVSTS